MEKINRGEASETRYSISICADLAELRRDLHAHPEIAFEERRTSDLVTSGLSEIGLEIHRGLARTGVVGTLTRGDGPSIGLRADMDALALRSDSLTT